MQSGAEKPDRPFIDRLFQQAQSEATQAEQRSDALTQYYALRSLVEDFRGLENTDAFSRKLAEVKGSSALKSAERKERHDIDQQAQMTSTLAPDLAQFGSVPEGQSLLGHQIASGMSDLRRRADSKSSDHLVAARAYMQLWIEALEAGQSALRAKNLSAAEAYFQLMADASPHEPLPMLFLAETKVRAGNKKGAMQAIHQAVQRGLKHARTLTEDPELRPLASDSEFQRIVQGLDPQ